MARPDNANEFTYALGAVSRLTGLSPHVLRAWERRYGAVQPLRTPGGTRRYREADLQRLRLLRAVVEAGHPIGQVAGLSDDELARRAAEAHQLPSPDLEPILRAAAAFDGAGAERLLGIHLSALGPIDFVGCVVGPLLREVGERWARGNLCVASEHLVSSIVRSLLGTLLRPRRAGSRAPTVLFTTPAGERHEVGTLVAAVVAAEVGADVVYLGPDLPNDQIRRAAEELDADAVAVGVVQLEGTLAAGVLAELRDLLPARTECWLGGPTSDSVDLPPGVVRVPDLGILEHKLALLGARQRGHAA